MPEQSPQSPHWQALAEHRQQADKFRISELFAQDPDRLSHFSIQGPGMMLDFSRHLADSTTMELLLDYAEKSGLSMAIKDLFDGKEVNNTEQRPALHMALRCPDSTTPESAMVQKALAQMSSFIDTIHKGSWKGFDGRPIQDVVNIGIGGSDLGPAMVYEALKPYHLGGIRSHFVSNVDPCHLEQTLEGLDPATTLFVIASKSFTTLETMENARAARSWILDNGAGEKNLPRHFVAVSSKVEKAEQFGIDPANVFPMWDWVGGRYSLWSAIGLPVALGVGMDRFRDLLLGAYAMDEHFSSAPLADNIPVIMGLLTFWYQDFFGAQSHVILPYFQNLHLFPAFLQQLDMESLGKSVHSDGSPVGIPTGGIIWGSAGTNGQHSFHQLLHQGTHLIPADFIAVLDSPTANKQQHQHLLANCFAQGQALMDGKNLDTVKQELQQQGMPAADIESLAPHKVIPGNRPSSSLVLKKLTPETLGSLIACYEHKVYTLSVLLGINAFDQWGVELGKILSTDIFAEIQKPEASTSLDPSTNALINLLKQLS